MKHITDQADFCRHCGGAGGTTDYEPDPYTGAMRERSNPCYHCEGSGYNTVRITAQPPAMEAAQ